MNRLLATSSLALLLLLPAARPSVAQTASDADLTRRAIEAILGYTNLSIFDDVQVAAEAGHVRLSGAVTMPHKRTDLERRIAAVPGVHAVANDIRVLRASRDDQILRVRVAQAIYSHPAFWAYSSMAHPPIRIIVERGRIVLVGEVASNVDRTLAYALAQVDGALGVTNELGVER